MAQAAFEELLRLAEAQLDAARRVDGAALGALTEERRRVQDELDVDALLNAPEAERAELRQMAARLRALDSRTKACGQSVLSLVSSLLPDAAPTTYGRRGQIRGS